MPPMKLALTLSLVLAGMAPAAVAASIEGDYLEARTADVYTGPCFANGEVNLAGKDAVLAWHVRRGSWNGTPLDGLGVVAVVRASATLGDPHVSPLPARASSRQATMASAAPSWSPAEEDRVARPRTAPSASTTSTAILVPPMSIPATGPAACGVGRGVTLLIDAPSGRARG